MDDKDYLNRLADGQKQTIAAHILPDGRKVWLRKAGRRNAAWRYVLLGAAVRCLGLPVLRPVPNLGGTAAIATEAARLREFAAAGVAAPRLLAQRADALLMSDAGGETVSARVAAEAAEGRLDTWRQGLAAIADVHGRGLALSQAFARNMVADGGGIAFIDFEDNPAAVLPFEQCRARDWLCYLHSTAPLLRRCGLSAEAALVWRHFSAGLPDAVRGHIVRSLRPLLWMRRLRSRRWGRDTLHLAAVAELAYLAAAPQDGV